jgi:hypothetical protein
MKQRFFLWIRPLVDGLITDRLLAFYRNMVTKGQVKEVPASGPAASLAAESVVTPNRDIGLGVVPKQV